MTTPDDKCVVCGQPASPKDGIEDRCGHHRRQLLRNQAKAKGLPVPTRRRSTTLPRAPRRVETPESPLAAVTPTELKEAHYRGEHATKKALACVLCIRAMGGRVDHVEMIREDLS